MLPYVFTDNSETGLKFSAILTLIALFIFGIFKSKVTGQPIFTGALKVLFIGALAAAAAYSIAKAMGV
jgi:VIT1/CCC1 family predicted Fe2+/Mn2+ transporter